MDLEIDKKRLSRAMIACFENGQRLHQDAESLGIDCSCSATVVALCILAQEEFAKAFLLHLVCEGIVPWTAKVRDSLRKHKHKQLLGLIMEWLSPSDDEFFDRIRMKRDTVILPAHVADAMKIYVEQVRPQWHIVCPPHDSDPLAKSVADGDRDKKKQDAIYVRLSDDGDVISIPTQVTPEMAHEELTRTTRLSSLVRPDQEGYISCQGLDYRLMVQTLTFFLLDKRDRPFLFLRESALGGPISRAGTTWPHSITTIIENISDEQATIIGGHATVFLDLKVVRPGFRFEQFVLDPYTAIQFGFFISDETYASAESPDHTLVVWIELEYHGIPAQPQYCLKARITFDPATGRFREDLTHDQKP